MEKPLTIARREFVFTLSELASKSGLPASMLCDIFKDAAMKMQQLDNEQYEIDKVNYEKAIASEKKGE